MNLKDRVTYQREDFFAFIDDYPPDAPVAMINILKFKAKSGNWDEAGQQAGV